MRDKEAENFWCPMGRVSLQKASNQSSLEVIQSGAFNIAVTVAPNSDANGSVHYSTRCIGEGCAMWRPGFFTKMGLAPQKWRSGQCGLATRYPADVFYALVLAAIAVSAYYFVVKFAF